MLARWSLHPVASKRLAAYTQGMTSEAHKLLEQVLALPEEDRLYLAEALQDSLEPVESQEEIDAAWKDELVRRVQSIEDGAAVLLDGDAVMSELKSKYGLNK
jgi:putative addiction module component (TIGR02574 family)